MEKEHIEAAERRRMSLRLHPQLHGRLAIYATMCQTTANEVISNLVEDLLDEVAMDEPHMRSLFEATDEVWRNQRSNRP